MTSASVDCSSYRVRFLGIGREVTVEPGTTLLAAAEQIGVIINSLCGGDGVCGRCRMRIRSGRVGGRSGGLLSDEEIRRGMVLACQTLVEDDLEVEIPPDTLASERLRVDEDAQRFRATLPRVRHREFRHAPLVFKVCLHLPPPTLTDPVGDAQRLQRSVRKLTETASLQTGLKVLRTLPSVLRQHNFTVTATVGRRRGVAEIMEVEGGDTAERNYLAVVDIGTSTVVAHLIRAHDGTLIGAQACFNSQSVCGWEVTSRIIYSERMGQESLQSRVVEDINRLIATLAADHNVNVRDITAVVCAGNTVMMHFLLGLPAAGIRRNPFVAVDLEPPPVRAAEVGIRVNPRALLFFVPAIGSWVGGDVTAGILATGLDQAEEISALIDIGTNGEIVVGNKDWLVACSASAGPALEGASVSCGMVAERGAIEQVYARDGAIQWRVIGDAPPRGLCGSGILDAVAVLLDLNVIDRSGRFVAGSHPALESHEGSLGFRLAAARETAHGKPLILMQEDLENVITAKAAIFAATKILFDRLQLRITDISRLFIAGGFGNFIHLENAIRIGLFPPLPPARIRYVGNTSIWGARLIACSEEACERAHEISRTTTYYDLMGSADYVEQFKQARFLPHTQIELFEDRGT